MKKFILSCITLCISLDSFAKVDTFQPQFPQFSSNTINQKNYNQFHYLGEAKFPNNVRIPFYNVLVDNPTDGDNSSINDYQNCSSLSCEFKFDLNADAAKKLKLIVIPNIGVTLVPRNWQKIEANVGANGTGSMLIKSPDQMQAIDLYDSAFCVGCGMRPATLYFPNLLKESVQNEFGGERDSKKFITLVHPNKYTAYFSYQIPKLTYKTHGVAKYTDQKNDFNFRVIRATLAGENQNLTPIILNFYQQTH